MGKKFKTQRQLTFREADPAQIMFFGNIFGLAHDAFEHFLPDAGMSWKQYFTNRDYLIPIRHTESDFKSPFYPGETYQIEVSVAAFRETSFQMRYVFSQNGKIHAEVKMVHAVLDGKTKQKVAIPEPIKTMLEPYLD